MSILRGSLDFRVAVVETASQLGIAERQVEKDYWVTETLRELVREFDGRFLFKGGTSLSKAYKLVQRFSEDIDLLLLSAEGEETEALLDGMSAAAQHVCGTIVEINSCTGGCARRVFVPYPQLPDTPKARGMRREIVLEPGIRGGPRPWERMRVESLIAQVLGAREYLDLTAFEIDVLHPARTMVEKLFVVDSLAAKLIADPQRRMADTEARHFYDLYFLWDEDRSPALAWLDEGSNRPDVLADCIAVSQRWYSESQVEVPKGGFANSAAFTDETITNRLRDGYNRMLRVVCYPGAARPTFEEIRARAAALASRI